MARLKCPNCEQVMKLTVKAGDAGKRVKVKCKGCEAALRVTLPRKSISPEVQSLLDDVLRRHASVIPPGPFSPEMRDLFGPRRGGKAN